MIKKLKRANSSRNVSLEERLDRYLGSQGSSLNEATIKVTFESSDEAMYTWKDGKNTYALHYNGDFYFGRVSELEGEEIIEACTDAEVKKQGKMIGEAIGRYLSKYGEVMDGKFYFGTGAGA